MSGAYTVLDRLENTKEPWYVYVVHAAIGVFFWLIIGKIAIHFGAPKKCALMMFPIIGLWPFLVPLILVGAALFGLGTLIF